MRKVANAGSRFVLQARLVNMKKFAAIILALTVAGGGNAASCGNAGCLDVAGVS